MSAKRPESAGVKTSPAHQRTAYFCRLARAAVLLLPLLFSTPARAQSALDGFDPNVNGSIFVIVTQPDGKILIGGNFTTVSPNGGAAVTRNRIARLNADGTLDPTFNPNANSDVEAIAVQPDGNVLVAGAFSSIGGAARNRIARLDPASGQSDSFNPNANNAVYAVAVQADGKILAGGAFVSMGGAARNHIARLDPTTGLADSFNPTADDDVYAIKVQPDGRILAGGRFSSIGGATRGRIARIDPASGQSDSFNPNATNGDIDAIAIQADGKVLVGGGFTIISGQTRNRIARLDATTGAADSFNPNSNAYVFSIALQADGKIFAGGFFSSIGGTTRNRIVRLDPVTGLADSFNPNPNNAVYAIAVQMDGKIVAGGDFGTLTPLGGTPVTRHQIARMETDGWVDQTLDLNISSEEFSAFVTVILVQPGGKILIAGRFSSVLGTPRKNIARVNADGTLDTLFNPNADVNVTVLALQADGKILAAGDFFNIGGQPRRRFARLDAITGLADSFNPDPDSQVYAIAVQADGRILTGGSFSHIGGATRSRMARLDPATGLADSFDPHPNSDVLSIAVQPDSKILVGGYFTNFGGPTRNRIARIDATTGFIDSFNPNADGPVSANVRRIVLQPDGKILVGGIFTTVGGQTRNNIARLDSTTGLADSFDPNADGDNGVYSIATQADGKVLVGGYFQNIGGATRHYFARLDSATGLADSFDINASQFVIAIALQMDGKILVGGVFTGPDGIGGQPRNFFARLTNDIGAVQSLDVAQTDITWGRDGSSPQFTEVTFAFSNDNANYVLLGNGAPVGNNWDLTGLNLPTGENFYIRGRGLYGDDNGGGITDFVRNAFLPGPTSTPSPTPTPPGPPTPTPTPTPTATTSPTPGPTPVPTPTGTPCGSPVPFENFDAWTPPALPPGWIAANQSAGDGVLWVTTTNQPDSAPICAFIPDQDGISDKALYMPPITITPETNAIAFRNNFDMETSGGTFWDGGVLEVSAPNIAGGTFLDVTDPAIGGNFVSGGYTGILSDLASNPLASRMAWSGSSSGYIDTVVNLGTHLIGQTVTFRFRMGTDQAVSAPGWRIDTISLLPGGCFPPPTPSPSPTASPIPTISPTPTPTPVPTSSPTPSPSPIPTPPVTLLGNISTRLRVETGDGAMIGGFIITGTEPKTVIVRGIGPSLPVSNALQDPVIEVHGPTGELVAMNDNWKDAGSRRQIIAYGLAPTNDLESALWGIINPGAYTVIVRGKNNTTGTGLFEVYDLDQTVDSKLGNVSTRGMVRTDDQAMIAGIIVLGEAPQRVIVRAIGPSLPVSGRLADPTLELRDGNGGLIRSNDNWRSDQENEIILTGIQPPNDMESALVATLPANGAGYTALVRGVNGTTGVALVEVYAVQ